MDNETLFYVFGIALAVSAVLVSFAGLRSEKFPGRAFPLVILWFAILVGGAATFAVLHAKDEDKAKAAEFAAENEKITKEESSPEPAETTAPETVKGPGDTLSVSVGANKNAFNTRILVAKHPGMIKIVLHNHSSTKHNIAIESNGKVIASSAPVAEGTVSVSAELGTGTARYLSTIPANTGIAFSGVLDVTP